MNIPTGGGSLGQGTKTHVLVTTAWFPSEANANGIFVKELAEALARRGSRVTALIVDHDNLRTLRERKRSERPRYLKSDVIKILRPRIVFPLPFRLFSDPEATYRRYIETSVLRTVRRHVRNCGGIDLVHHHCLSDNSYIARLIAEDLGVPYVFTEHSNYWKYEDLNRFNSFETQAEHFDFVRSAAARTAPSEMRAEGYGEIFGADFICIPNLVARLFESPVAPRGAGGPFRFICAAILHERKRQDLLLRAFASTFKGQDVSLTLVGNGPREDDYRALAAELGIGAQVEFAGIRNREEVRALFDASHVGVLSSDQETFGIVLTEAMFRGIPVVSTRSGGPEEIVGPGRGILVPVGDEKALADALRTVRENYASYDSRAIRDWAVARYSEDVIAAQMEGVYRAVCPS